jgi:hypothetical protein
VADVERPLPGRLCVEMHSISIREIFAALEICHLAPGLGITDPCRYGKPPRRRDESGKLI